LHVANEKVWILYKLTGLWNELRNYNRVPPCKRGAAEKMLKMMEEDKIHQFLMGLDDNIYSIIRSQILAHDPLPSLDKVFNIIQQEDNHKAMMINQDIKQDSTAMFAVDVHGRSSTSTTEKSSCKHCGKYGHDEAECFELICYPPGWSSCGGRGGCGKGRGGRGGDARNGVGRG